MENSKEGLVFIVRHGERADCVENEEEIKKIEIAVDPHLTELGKLQAKCAALELQTMINDYKNDKNRKTKYFIVSSPFLRCMQTATGIAQALGKENILNDKIYIDLFLSEFLNKIYFQSSPMDQLHFFAKLESLKEILGIEIQQGLLEEGKHTDVEVIYPESIEKLFDRATSGYKKALELYEELVKKEEDGDVALILVTHGYGVQCLLDYHEAFDFTKGVEYTSVSQFFYDFETKKTRVGNIQWHEQLEKAQKEFDEICKKNNVKGNL